MNKHINFRLFLLLLSGIGICLFDFFLRDLFSHTISGIGEDVSKKVLLKKYKSFRLENKVIIDTADEKIAEKGLFDIADFCVDDEENIYVLNDKSEKSTIFKFDSQGNFRGSFGRKGQGPGEIERPEKIHIINDRIFIHDLERAKIVIFGKDGNMVNELKIPAEVHDIYPLSNGMFVGQESFVNANVKEFVHSLNYYDREFNKVKQLDRLNYPNPFQAPKIKAYLWRIIVAVSKERIYSGYPERGYEILGFDLNGNLIKKIYRKQSDFSDITNYKKIVLQYFGMLPKIIMNKIEFPKCPPPFHSFIADEFGNLFVMTYKPGKKGEFLYDIINSQGILIKEVSLGVHFDQNSIHLKIKGGKLFWIRERESGEKELIVSKIQ